MTAALLDLQLQRARQARVRFRAARRAVDLAAKATHAAVLARPRATGSPGDLAAMLDNLTASGGFVARCRETASRLEHEAIRLAMGGAR